MNKLDYKNLKLFRVLHPDSESHDTQSPLPVIQTCIVRQGQKTLRPTLGTISWHVSADKSGLLTASSSAQRGELLTL
jgi:hypothetical protein